MIPMKKPNQKLNIHLIKKSKLFSWDGSDQVIYGPMDSSSFYGIMQEKGLQSIELRTLRRYDK